MSKIEAEGKLNKKYTHSYAYTLTYTNIPVYKIKYIILDKNTIILY